MSANYRTAQAFVKALDAKRVTELKTYMSKDFLYHAHPKRLNSFGKPQGFTKDEFAGFIEGIKFVQHWKFEVDPPKKVVESDASIVFHMNASPLTSSGVQFETEFIYFLDFDKEGKVVAFNEFFDTVYVSEGSKAAA